MKATNSWQTGTPDVPAGGREAFWCATRGNNGEIFHRHLEYLNREIMGLADSQDDADPKCATPVDDDGDYAWTGWFEPSCDQCETQWHFGNEVVAWMRLPKFSDHARK